MYKKTKIHRGPMAKCKQCMAKIAEQDPGYAALLSRSVVEKPKRGK
jgi:hypothetical protein